MNATKIQKCKFKTIDLHFEMWYNFNTLSQQFAGTVLARRMNGEENKI